MGKGATSLGHFLNNTLVFEWCVVRCGSKNGHQKGIMCFKEIGLHVQTLVTTLSSIVDIN